MSTTKKCVNIVSYWSLAEFTIRNGFIATRSTSSHTKKCNLSAFFNYKYLNSITQIEIPSKLKARHVRTSPGIKYFFPLFFKTVIPLCFNSLESKYSVWELNKLGYFLLSCTN